MIEYNAHVIDTLALRRRGWGVGVPPFKPFRIKGIGGQKMKSELRDKGPPVQRAFPRIGISWFFPDHGGTLNCIMTLILSNLHGMLPEDRRLRKCSKRPQNTPR